MAKKKSPAADSEKGLQLNNLRACMCLVFIIVGLMLFISMFMFLIWGKEDQSIVRMSFYDLWINSDIVASNMLGKWGAYVSHLLVNEGVGVLALAIPSLLMLVGIRAVADIKMHLVRIVFHTFLAVVWGSTALGFLFYRLADNMFIQPGGAHGYFMAKYLMSVCGGVGTFFVLLLTLGIYLVFTVDSFSGYLKRGVNALVGKMLKLLKRGKVENPDMPGIDGGAIPAADDAVLPEVRVQPAAPVEPEAEEPAETDEEDDDYPEPDEPYEPEPAPVPEPPKGDEPPVYIERPSEPEEAEPDEPTENIVINHGGEPEESVIPDTEPYDPTLDLPHYKLPTFDLLVERKGEEPPADDEVHANIARIKDILQTFGVAISSITATVGPTVTLYEIVPEGNVRISRIQSLGNDIALRLSAYGTRIIAPIPGKGTVGVEVPNSKRRMVSMMSVLKSSNFQNSSYELPIAIGKTISNETFVFDLAKTPHLLVAGATGQGKSVGLNAIVTSLLYKKHPAQVKFVMVDPKMVEFSIYRKLEKHFLAKVASDDDAIITDVEKVKNTLNSLTVEMDDRYRLLQKVDLRNIKEYNKKFISRALNPLDGHRYLPYIVVIIDEFADLIMQAGKTIEEPIARIAQKARAVGIHMILATQRPSTNIITGVIKSNFPARIAFKTASMIDSRTILDSPGAEQLVGMGDMLISLDSVQTRVQCAFIDTDEVIRINDYVREQRGYMAAYELPECAAEGGGGASEGGMDAGKFDALFADAARMVVQMQNASASNIQRRFAIGYNRAGKLVDQMERVGIVSAPDNRKNRTVLVQMETDLERILTSFGIS